MFWLFSLNFLGGRTLQSKWVQFFQNKKNGLEILFHVLLTVFHHYSLNPCLQSNIIPASATLVFQSVLIPTWEARCFLVLWTNFTEINCSTWLFFFCQPSASQLTHLCVVFACFPHASMGSLSGWSGILPQCNTCTIGSRSLLPLIE